MTDSPAGGVGAHEQRRPAHLPDGGHTLTNPRRALGQRLAGLTPIRISGILHVADLGLDTATDRVAVENFADAPDEALLVLAGEPAR